MSRFHPTRPTAEDRLERGAHTLDVFQGTIVGIYGEDVFVELGPRREGVIPTYAFVNPPSVGEEYSFTLGGREDSLWALNLIDERTLEQWEELQEGSLITARVLHKTSDGYQLKIGPLHAFMPFSKSGIRKTRERGALLGRSVVVEVISVDDDKQRAIVSRKSVLKMQRAGGNPNAFVPGQTIQGRVSRVESYGIFIKVGRGREGLCHISNMSLDRIDHPSEIAKVGDVIESRVLYVRAGGKRIGLGLKQLLESPWGRVEREHWEGQIVPVELIRTGSFGAVAKLFPGVEGIVPVSECGGLRPGQELRVGDRRSARIMELDPDNERVAFSLVHPSGRPIDLDEAETMALFETLRDGDVLGGVMGDSEGAGNDGSRPTSDAEAPNPGREGASTNVGDLLRRALERRSD